MDMKSYEAAVIEADRGHFADALEFLKRPKNGQRRASAGESVLTAEMLHHTGDSQAARRMAQSLISSDLHGPLASRCLSVLGLCAFEAGHRECPKVC